MFRGNPVYAVNGLFIRGDGTQTENIDIDFIEGGNYACYPYIPSPELWVDEVLSYKDRVYTILHEFLECRKMVYENWNYDTGKHRAHHYADHIEALMRVDPTIKFSTDFISDLETLYQRAKDRGLLH